MSHTQEIVNSGGNGVPNAGSPAVEALRQRAEAAVLQLQAAFAPILVAVPRDELGPRMAPHSGGLQTLCDRLEEALERLLAAVRAEPDVQESGRARAWLDLELASCAVEDWWALLEEMHRCGVQFGEPAGRYRAMEATAANLAALGDRRPAEWDTSGPAWWLAVEAPCAAYFDACEGARPWQEVAAELTAAAAEARALATATEAADADPAAIHVAALALCDRIAPLICSRSSVADDPLAHRAMRSQREAQRSVADAAVLLLPDHLHVQVAAAKLRFGAEGLAQAVALLHQACEPEEDRRAA